MAQASIVMKKRVLVICSGNSARSQMAEALIRHEAGDVFEVFSAGTHPAQVRLEAVKVMRELWEKGPMVAGKAAGSPRSDSQFRSSANQKRGNGNDEVYDVCVLDCCGFQRVSAPIHGPEQRGG
jgi:hypothetical protein